MFGRSFKAPKRPSVNIFLWKRYLILIMIMIILICLLEKNVNHGNGQLKLEYLSLTSNIKLQLTYLSPSILLTYQCFEKWLKVNINVQFYSCIILVILHCCIGINVTSYNGAPLFPQTSEKVKSTILLQFQPKKHDPVTPFRPPLFF